MTSIRISDIDSDTLASLVRDGAYTSGETIGYDSGNRFLLVLAVPYGEIDIVETKLEALEAFHELLDSSDWFERNIKCLTIDQSGRPVIEELRHEDLEAEEDGELFTCRGCGRAELECSIDPCPSVVADREA